MATREADECGAGRPKTIMQSALEGDDDWTATVRQEPQRQGPLSAFCRCLRAPPYSPKEAGAAPRPATLLSAGSDPQAKQQRRPKKEEMRVLLQDCGAMADEGDDEVTDEVGAGKWFWGHSLGSREPPNCPVAVQLATGVLSPYYRDMIRQKACESYPYHLAFGNGGRCPFLGGTLYQSHADCERLLRDFCPALESGRIVRRNDLGFLVLDNGAFPEPHRRLGINNPVNVHQEQRRCLATLIGRIPRKCGLMREVHNFMSVRSRIEFPKDVDVWWTGILWRYVVGKKLPDSAFCESFIKFRSNWLASAVAQVGQVSISDVLFTTDDHLKALHRHRDEIEELLSAEVPQQHRQSVAEAALEMMCFAGGLSVPNSITCAVASMYTGIMPDRVTENNAEAFAYEVTRLFPAVQGFPWYDEDGHRHILHLAASLKDPTVWGVDADKFTLKEVGEYKEKHLGFANLAVSSRSPDDSRYCPGIKQALDAIQAFTLVLSSWSYTQDAAACRCADLAWRAVAEPRPAAKPSYWRAFALQRPGVDLGKDLRLYSRLTANSAPFLDFTPEEFEAFVNKVDVDGDGVADRLGDMNFFTRVFLKVAKRSWRNERSIENVEVPRAPAMEFTKDNSETIFGNIRLPIEDEQWDGMPFFQTLAKRALFFANGLSGDGISEKLLVRTPGQRKEAIFVARQAFLMPSGGSYLPAANDMWKSFANDKAQGLLALYSIGQLDLRRNPWPELGEFMVDPLSDALAALPLRSRDEFESLGAVAFFDRYKGGKELKIRAIDWREGGRVVRPGDDDWERAKYAWRCSMQVKTTVVEHLVFTHFIVANALSTSLRASFRPDHPIRRLLHVHTYSTASINHSAFTGLLPENGFLHGMTPFEYKGVESVFELALSKFEYKTRPQAFQELDLPEDFKRRMPMWEDGLAVWNMFREFYAGYIDLYYESDEEVCQDREIQHYWKFSATPPYARGLPKLSKDALIDQITESVYWVCAHHEFVGGVVEFGSDPAGLFLQVRKGQSMADMQHMLQALSLAAITGSPMPKLSADWSFLLDLGAGARRNRFAEAKALFDRLQARMREVSAQVAERNGRRPQPLRAFDPLAFECSCSL